MILKFSSTVGLKQYIIGINIIVIYVTKEISKETNQDISWDTKIQLKNRLSSKDKIKCIIESVNVKRGCAYIKISISNLDVTKIIALDATLSLDSETAFEKFLKYNGISPIEDNVAEKLQDLVIYPEAEIKNGELVINTESLYKEDNFNSPSQSKKLKPLVLGFITGFILVTTIVLSMYSLSLVIGVLLILVSVVFIANFGTL